MTKRSDLWIRKTREEWDNIVHKILVVKDGILTMIHKGVYEIAKIAVKLFPLWSRHNNRIFSTFLNINIIIKYFTANFILKIEETLSNSSVIWLIMAECSMLLCIWADMFPLHPEALMKNCIMAHIPESLSVLYCSIHSSTISYIHRQQQYK